MPDGLVTPSSPVPGEESEGSDPATAAITGISIDTRTIQPGDLFVALKDVRDGHEFVTTAFKNGATTALVNRAYVRQPGDGMLLRVDDPLRALEALGRAARARLSPLAQIIAITGSVGKTTTKEMLRACLSAIAPGQTHAADKSFNNHWGVPLTLARMPADTTYGVFEIGMNHAGEITPLTKMVRPHVAIVTTVAAAHLEHFASVEEIAKAKAEIFSGLEQGGMAIIPADNVNVETLRREAVSKGAIIKSFGYDNSDLRLRSYEGAFQNPFESQSVLARNPQGHSFAFDLGMRGEHMATNALAVILTLQALGCDVDQCLPALASMAPSAGRGERTLLGPHGGQILLIDESYNANPTSMEAAIATAAGASDEYFPRRIAVLGDMLELGPQADALHRDLLEPILKANIDLVLACGPHMRHLYDALPPEKQGGWAPTSEGIRQTLLETVKGGDVVMIKGSNGSKMAPLVAALKARHTPVKSDT